MTLGQRIAQHRKNLGISQEELGSRLGVSRQAVSKWETNAATPDMANLIAMSQEFNISLEELTQTPEAAPVSKRRRWPQYLPWALLFIVLIGVLLWSWGNGAGQTATPALDPTPELSLIPSPEPTSDPASGPASDLALVWTGESGDQEFLELGLQADFFPFGASLVLTQPEEVLDSDLRSLTVHRAHCGALFVEYYHIEEDLEVDPESPERESVVALSTIVPGYATPRGVGPGSTEADLLAAYGDELVYCLGEENGYTLVPHERYYIWSSPAPGSCAIFFFIARGEVAGIYMESIFDADETFYTPNYVTRFPMKGGQPDFSLRREPEREELTDTRRVYIAFNQLLTGNNLTAEERYACRLEIFSLLPLIDWQELGQMGAAERPDETIFALMDWIRRQDACVDSEILSIQWGSAAKGLDGAYSEYYAQLLSHALFYDPVTFASLLVYNDDTPNGRPSQAVQGAAYDAILHPRELAAARETLESALSDGFFTEAEADWCRYLLLYLEAAEHGFQDLPTPPAS